MSPRKKKKRVLSLEEAKCTCSASHQAFAHYPACQLWDCIAFLDGEAFWDDGEKTLIELVEFFSDPTHDDDCTCTVCIDFLLDTIRDEDKSPKALPLPLPGECPKDQLSTESPSTGWNAGLVQGAEAVCKCPADYKGSEKWPHHFKCPLDQDYEKNKDKDWFKNSGGKSTWSKCRHYQAPVELPGGATVFASSSHSNRDIEKTKVPDFGVYLDGIWKPDCYGVHVGCPDFGTPKPPMPVVFRVAREAIELAEAGQLVEVGCIGGHGRTGLFLTILCLVAAADQGVDLSAEDALKHVRETYCEHAVESPKQEWYLKCVDAELHGEAWPEEPKATPVYSVTKTTKTVTTTHSTKTIDESPWDDCQEPGCQNSFNTFFHDKFCSQHRPLDEQSTPPGGFIRKPANDTARLCEVQDCNMVLSPSNPTTKCFNHRDDKMFAPCRKCGQECSKYPEWMHWNHVSLPQPVHAPDVQEFPEPGVAAS